MEFIDVFSIHFNTFWFLQVVRKQTLVEVKTKHLFNSQLCQKYFCHKLSKSVDLSLSYDR